MKTPKKWLVLLLAAALVCGTLGTAALAAEELEEEEDYFADAYVYYEDDGMPKYWLDLTGSMADDLVLHCFFRSSDPTFYESCFFLDLDTADIDDEMIDVHTITDEYGFDRSDWFDTCTILILDDELILHVKRDESTLAGGSEDNILTGVYRMEPAAAGVVYEYFDDDGELKYWIDMDDGEEDIVLHGMFLGSDPEPYESTYTFDLDSAEWSDDEETMTIKKVLGAADFDVSGWFKSLVLTDEEGGIRMDVKRDEKTLAGGSEGSLMTGSYLLAPRAYLILTPEEGPFTADELALLARQYYFLQTGFFPPEADVEENRDGTFTIHLYEVADGRTATSAWYTVDDMGVGEDDILGGDVYLAGR